MSQMVKSDNGRKVELLIMEMNGVKCVETIAVHGGARKDDTFGAVNGPIYMTSNYRIPTDGSPVDWSGTETNIYARNRNVNQWVLLWWQIASGEFCPRQYFK